MLTAKDALRWVTRRPAPPWSIRELAAAFQANPTRAFSLKQAITGLEKQTCVIAVGIRDPGVLQSATSFADLKANWDSSAPSKNTLNSVINILGAQGITLNYLSKDWKIAGIVSSLANLKNVQGTFITEDSPGHVWGERAIVVGEAVAVLGLEPLAGAFILTGGITYFLGDTFLDDLNGAGGAIPQTPGPSDAFPQTPDDTGGSSAGGDTSAGPDPSVLVIPLITITGSWPDGVDPSKVTDSPPLNLGTFVIGPDDGSGGGGGGNGGGGVGPGGGGGVW
jgi:hypothetical protein